MTEKELLYVEDALNHEMSLCSICENFEEIVKDENLKKFIKSTSKTYDKCYQNIYALLK